MGVLDKFLDAIKLNDDYDDDGFLDDDLLDEEEDDDFLDDDFDEKPKKKFFLKIQAATAVMISVATNPAAIPSIPIPSICFHTRIPTRVAGRTTTAFSRNVAKLAMTVSSMDS